MTRISEARKTELGSEALTDSAPRAMTGASQVRLGFARAGARRLQVLTVQIGLVIAWLAAWQYLPTVPAIARSSHIFDPFFISSPSLVADRMLDLFFGRNGYALIWPALWQTLSSSVAGVVVGSISGVTAGLLLSSSRFASDVLRAFLVTINAIPRVALIPVIIIVVGPTFQSSVVLSVMVTFFVMFWNSYEGGRSVPRPTLQSALLLGATHVQVMRYVRLPYVTAWALASLPLAVNFGILSVVTGEILTGYGGIGRLILQSATSANATLTIAVAILLAVISLILIGALNQLKVRMLHWWLATQL